MFEDMEAKKVQNARNNANNANLVSNLADVASKTSDPTLKAIGTGVKAADKLTGGKASQMVGNALTKNNNATPHGRMLQKGINKLGESGATDRLTQALNKKNGVSSNNNLAKQQANNSKSAKLKSNSMFDSTSKKETKEQASDGGLANYTISSKVIKVGLIAFIPVCIAFVFICLLSSASQIYYNAVGLDAADSTSSSDAEEKIGNLKDEEASEEITDENISFDLYISNEKSTLLKESKLKRYVQIKKTTYIERKYRTVDLDELHDFYPPVKTMKDDYDTNLVYDFFFKMYNLNKSYKENYNVNLDLPLLMATLRIQSTDMNEVFELNLEEEDRKDSARKMPIEEYDYYYDWSTSDYKISKEKSEHDMELLAQRMVRVYDYTESTTCEQPTEDNKCYVVDTEQYKEFLYEFLEKKYLLAGEHSISKSSNSSDGGTTTPGLDSNVNNQESPSQNTSSMAEEMIKIANNEYAITNGKKGGKKYWSAYGSSVKIPWCVTFAWYVSSNTKYNGMSLYPDIIKYKSASTGGYMKYFHTSVDSNIKFYYNDSCSTLSGKNGSINYKPKPGDYIFFDWQKKFSNVNQSGPGYGQQDHTGIVEKYENGMIYTIEGNISDTVFKRKISINDCSVIGFGSWY